MKYLVIPIISTVLFVSNGLAAQDAPITHETVAQKTVSEKTDSEKTGAGNTKVSAMLGLRTTVYSFENLQAGKEWYAKAFGIQPYFDEPYYVGFNIRGFELGLMPESTPSAKGTNVIAYWGVENIESEYQRLLALGATSNTPIAAVGGGIKLGSVNDPFGNVLGLIYNPVFKAE